MQSDFNLSNKIEEADENTIEEYGLIKYEQEWIYVEDVKEFIKILRNKILDLGILEEFKDLSVNKAVEIVDDLIKKYAGEKLK